MLFWNRFGERRNAPARPLMLYVLVGLSVTISAHSGLAQLAQPERERGDVTKITSESLTFDYRQQFALFQTNVVVENPDININAEWLRVRFDENDNVKKIVAKNDVRIEQEDTVAESGKATYTVSDGKIVLEENPEVRRDSDVLRGERIVFYRDQKKIVSHSQVSLTIYPENEGMGKPLVGSE